MMLFSSPTATRGSIENTFGQRWLRLQIRPSVQSPASIAGCQLPAPCRLWARSSSTINSLPPCWLRSRFPQWTSVWAPRWQWPATRSTESADSNRLRRISRTIACSAGKCGKRGFDVVLSSYVVEHDVVERNLASLWAHELRWARTMFSARPAGYAFSFIMYAVPMSLIYWAVSRDAIGGALLTGAALGLRLALHYVARRALRITSADSPWLIPLRDLLGLAVWVTTFFGRGVRWRDRDFVIDAAGRMERR